MRWCAFRPSALLLQLQTMITTTSLIKINSLLVKRRIKSRYIRLHVGVASDQLPPARQFRKGGPASSNPVGHEKTTRVPKVRLRVLTIKCVLSVINGGHFNTRDQQKENKTYLLD